MARIISSALQSAFISLMLIKSAVSAEGDVSREVLDLSMQEWRQLSLFVRGDYIKKYAQSFDFDSEQKTAFHACLVAASRHPDYYTMSFRSASRMCVTYARNK